MAGGTDAGGRGIDGGPETVRKELTLKDVIDGAVETGTFDELRTSGSWDEYRLRCEAADSIPVPEGFFRIWERLVTDWM